MKSDVKQYIGKEVNVIIDRPIGSRHPNYPDSIYLANYFILIWKSLQAPALQQHTCGVYYISYQNATFPLNSIVISPLFCRP